MISPQAEAATQKTWKPLNKNSPLLWSAAFICIAAEHLVSIYTCNADYIYFVFAWCVQHALSGIRQQQSLFWVQKRKMAVQAKLMFTVINAKTSQDLHFQTRHTRHGWCYFNEDKLPVKQFICYWCWWFFSRVT